MCIQTQYVPVSKVSDNHFPIEDNFNKALEIMNRAVSSHIQPGVKENMAYFSQMERRQMVDTSGLPSTRSPPRQTTGPEPAVCTYFLNQQTDYSYTCTLIMYMYN